MNGKQSKKLKAMAKMFAMTQTQKTPDQIYKQLKQIHKNKQHGSTQKDSIKKNS